MEWNQCGRHQEEYQNMETKDDNTLAMAGERQNRLQTSTMLGQERVHHELFDQKADAANYSGSDEQIYGGTLENNHTGVVNEPVNKKPKNFHTDNKFH